MAFIEFHDVCKYYKNGDHKIAAADHVNFEAGRGGVCGDRGAKRCGEDYDAQYPRRYG